jgi:CheY-like chemotaxis protein
MEEEEEKVS